MFAQPFNLYGTHDTYTGHQASASLGNRKGAWSWWFNLNRLDSEGQPLVFATRPPSEGAPPLKSRADADFGWEVAASRNDYRNDLQRRSPDAATGGAGPLTDMQAPAGPRWPSKAVGGRPVSTASTSACSRTVTSRLLRLADDWVLKASRDRAVRMPTVSDLYQGSVSSTGTLDNSDPNGEAYQGVSKFFSTDLRVRHRINRQWSAALGVDNLNNQQYWNFHPYPRRTWSAELAFDL